MPEHERFAEEGPRITSTIRVPPNGSNTGVPALKLSDKLHYGGATFCLNVPSGPPAEAGACYDNVDRRCSSLLK